MSFPSPKTKIRRIDTKGLNQIEIMKQSFALIETEKLLLEERMLALDAKQTQPAKLQKRKKRKKEN